MSLFQKLGDIAARIFVRAGLCVSKFAAAILLALIKGAKFVLDDFEELLKLTGNGVIWLWKELTKSFRERVKLSNDY